MLPKVLDKQTHTTDFCPYTDRQIAQLMLIKNISPNDYYYSMFYINTVHHGFWEIEYANYGYMMSWSERE